MVFLHGEFKHQLDDKFRLRLPAKFRTALGKFVVMKAVNGCLYAISLDTFEERIRSKTKSIPLLDPAVQATKTKIFSSIDIPDEDGQGRFVLPAPLREFAGITKNVMIIGSDDYFQIWDSERWEKAKTGDYELNEENIRFNNDMELLKEYQI